MGKLVSVQWPQSFSSWLNHRFAKIFSINTEEAEYAVEEYPSIQEFFIRRLKSGAREVAIDTQSIISPCDGVMSEAGLIDQGRVLQVKGKYYNINDLLGSRELAAPFMGGYFCTIYLSPKDYHRFHVPVDGIVSKTKYIPGNLWPVNKWAVQNIPELFCNNERTITLIKESQSHKHIAYVAVGATMVGKIKLDYTDVESNCGKAREISHEAENQVKLNKGDELGRFMFGSTIVMLFEKALINGFEKVAPAPVRMGEVLARIKKEA